jgi:hypothetical protein
MRANTVLTGAVVAAFLGCGGVTGIPIEKTATEFSKAICDAAYKCCTPETLMGNAAAGKTEAECEANTAQNFRNSLQNMQNSENAGRAKYKQDDVDACLAALRAADCPQLTSIRSLSGIPECNSTFATPLVAAGGVCGQDYECIGGVCEKAEGAWEGVCVAGNAKGAACANDNRCASDLICDQRGTGSDPSDDVCVAEQDNGATCVDGFECKSRNCVADSATGARTCQAQTAAQCFYGGGCAAGGGRPSLAALVLMGLFVVVALARTRRATRGQLNRDP